MNMFLNSRECCTTGNHIILCKYLIFPKTDARLVQLCHTVCNSETVSSHAIVLQYNWCMWYVTQTIVPWSKHEAVQHVLSTLCLTSYSRCEAHKATKVVCWTVSSLSFWRKWRDGKQTKLFVFVDTEEDKDFCVCEHWGAATSYRF